MSVNSGSGAGGRAAGAAVQVDAAGNTGAAAAAVLAGGRAGARAAAGAASAAAAARSGWIDAFRGLLIAHMALDHASLMFNLRRGAEELARVMPALPPDGLQFLTRFTGVPVAPGFFFMAGFMVAVTSAGRSARGVAQHEVTRRLVTRGLVLLLVDATVMGLPRLAMGFYSFAVLSCIGASLIVLALLRHWPQRVLLPLALAVLLLHPLVDVSGLPVALQALLHEPVRSGALRSQYPLLPWLGCVLLGYVVGRDGLRRAAPGRLWLAAAAISLVLFFVVRLSGGYGNAYPTADIGSLAFWQFAKYPPDLPFLAWALASVFLGLALFQAVGQRGPSAARALLRPLQVYGRVPFFFYVVHFYLLGIAAALLRTKFELPAVYAIWLLLLALMLPLCAGYARLKRTRPNIVTRWL